jgi:putative peptidoglycan lipid II flippase
VWNIVIIVLLVVLAPHFHGEDKIYAFAIGILVATVVQVLMAFAALGRIDFRLRVHIDWHDPRIRQVFACSASGS